MPPSLRGVAARTVLILLVAWCAACTGGGAAVRSPSSGALAGEEPSAAATTNLPVGRAVSDDTRMCDLLGPGDFEVAGIPGAGLPEATTDGPGTAYCVYAGESGAAGGIELDAFVDEDPARLYDVIRNEGSVALESHEIPGADRAEGWEGVAGEPASFARMLVRTGNLVFAMSAPGGPGMDERLAELAALVVTRGSALAGS